jgi:dTDP-4-amino-4,6-dideoxygalactose transaminase
VASSSQNALLLLERTALRPLIDCISDGRSSGRRKPYPDQFEHVAAQLGVAPSRCVVVEDSVVGIEAARRAGMGGIAIGEVACEASQVDAAFDSLADVDIEEFMGRVVVALEDQSMRIPINNLGPENAELIRELTDGIQAVLRRGDFMLGEPVDLFESRFAEWCQAKWAVGVNSGTDALALTFRALGIGPGDEVITVPNTFVATVGAILQCGATPVFVDVGEDENMDPDSLAEAMTERTRAVVPVHLRGRPARMDRIMEIADRHGVFVIEDCAQAHGARFAGKPVGTFGVAGCFSMHPQKILGACGDAGVIITSDAALADRLRLLRHHGLRTRDRVEIWGCNSRLDSLQAAVLTVKLGHLEKWIRRRRALASQYFEGLDGLPLQLPVEREPEYAVYYLFTVQAERRDQLRDYLREQGIDARIHYPKLIPDQPAAMGARCHAQPLANARRQCDRILSLPIYPSLSEEDLQYVVRCVRRFCGRAT